MKRGRTDSVSQTSMRQQPPPFFVFLCINFLLSVCFTARRFYIKVLLLFFFSLGGMDGNETKGQLRTWLSSFFVIEEKVERSSSSSSRQDKVFKLKSDFKERN